MQRRSVKNNRTFQTIASRRSIQAIRETYTSVYEFLDKAQHLAAIHKAPADGWPCLAAALVEAGWNVADTEAVVAEVVKAAGRIAPCRGTLPLLTPSRTTLPRR